MTGLPSEPAVACALCGGEATASRFEKGRRHFLRCATCAFQFSRSDTNANLEQRLEDYEPAYLQYLDSSPVDDANHAATIEWVERFATLNDPRVSLLDVGAGSGKLLRCIQASRRCQTAGVEPSEALFHAFHLDSLNVTNLSLPQFHDAVASTFDVVTALDVIEHVSDPAEFARSLYLVTKPGGFVFLSTPDVGSFVARAFGRHWHHYNRYHLSLFDSRSIAWLGRNAGFSIIEVDHRGKRFPLGYLRRYARDFLLQTQTRSRPSSNDGGRAVFLNLFDIMSTVWRKRS